ncbi:hypothetical protein Tco_0080581 [Tanacetum coccineum]
MIRNWPTHKSSYVMNTDVPKVEHSRNSNSFLDSKRFVCSTCQKCVFNANHDACITKLLKKVNSRTKVHSHKTTKRYIPVEKKSNAKKPERQIPIGQKFYPNKSFVVYVKTTPPRSGLTWKPTGRIFTYVGLRWIPTEKSVRTCLNTNDSAIPLGKETCSPKTVTCANSLSLSAGTSMASEPNSSKGSSNNIRVILFSIHIEDGNPSSVNIKQHYGRYQDYQDKYYQRRLLASFQDDAKYEHVGQDTRSQDGKDDKYLKDKDLKVSELKSKSKEKAQDQRSQRMKEQAYNNDNELERVAKLKTLQWELPAKFLGLSSQVSSVQEKLKTLDALPSLLNKSKLVLPMLRGEKNIKDADKTNLKQQPTTTIPPTTSSVQSPLFPNPPKSTPQTEGGLIKKNKGKEVMSSKDAEEEETESDSEDDHANPADSMVETSKIEETLKAKLAKQEVEKLKNELINLMGTDVVTQYYNKKFLYDKYCDKILKRKKSSKITNCDVLTKKGHITMKIYREDGTNEVISNFKVSDLYWLLEGRGIYALGFILDLVFFISSGKLFTIESHQFLDMATDVARRADIKALSPTCDHSSSSTGKQKSLPLARLPASSSRRSLLNRNVRRRLAINQSSIPATRTCITSENVPTKIPESSSTHTQDNEVSNIMQHFGGSDRGSLDLDIVQRLIHILHEHNELVRLFRTTRDKCRDANVPDFNIRLYNIGGIRRYELPTSRTLGGILFESGPRSRTYYDVIIELRGFYPKLKLKPQDGSGRGKKQYVMAVYCTIEQSRMDFVRTHQNDIRCEYLPGLYDVVSRGYRDGIAVGSHIILPTSFTKGSRCMYMAQYPELTPADRADIVCIVFQQKVKDFLKFLIESEIFGDVTGVPKTRTATLSHTTVVDPNYKIENTQEVDQYISAELPDTVDDPFRYKVVSEMMIHGSCGAANLNAPCMQNGPRNKKFPERYNNETFFDSNGHVHYRRRDTGIHITKRELNVDNCYVVPYNRALCLAFQAHINVKYCGWSMLIKYFFKYISKGSDRIIAKITKPIGEAYTSIGNQQRINYHGKEQLEAIINMPYRKKTTLVEWYEYNNANTDGRHLTYLNFPSEFCGTQKQRIGDQGKFKPRSPSKD